MIPRSAQLRSGAGIAEKGPAFDARIASRNHNGVWIIVLAAFISSCGLESTPLLIEPVILPPSGGGGGLMVDVRLFGARVDGTTDDTKALQAAIDTLFVRGGGTILIPGGTLLLSLREKTAIILRQGVRLRGEGVGTSILSAPAAAADYDGIMIDLPEHVTASVESLSLRGPAETLGTHTTQGILHHGGTGRLLIKALRVSSFTECIKAHGTASIEATECEFAEAEQGVLHVGTGNVYVTDCVFRDTRVQPLKLTPGHDHGIYAYQGVRVLATRTTFRNITGYGIQLWGGSAPPQAVLVVDCLFDACALGGVLGNDGFGSVTEIRTSRFMNGGDGVHMQSGRVELNACAFATGRFGVRQEPGLGGEGEGGLLMTNCSVQTLADNFGVYMGTGGVWLISKSVFSGSGSAAVGKYDSTGTLDIEASQFTGVYTKAILDLRGAVTTVRGCLLGGSSPYGILATGYRTGVPTIVHCEGDTISASGHGIYLWPDRARVELYGANTLFLSGTALRGGSSSTGERAVIRLQNRSGESLPIISADTITLNWNFDTYHVSGGRVIQTILMPGTFDTGDFGRARAVLVADGPWSLSAGGNIIPASSLPRSATARVELAFDSNVGRWREVTRSALQQ